MEMKTRRESRITRKRSNQPKKSCPKLERNASLRKVSVILRKNEALRSAEEVAVLASMADEVREVKCRLKKREMTLLRSIEKEDDFMILKNKCKQLARAMKNAKHLVVYTGAGISTAADIPDYRGPNGIWTLLQQGKNIGKHDLTRAQPTLTHMALKELHMKGMLKFVVSQNCDGLHLRSGLPRRALSEVHGNMYVELCLECKPNIQYWRLFDTTERTARYFHKTGRICHFCGGPLTDSIVHFGERGTAQWPLNWAGAIHHAEKADVILCLGSSLKVLKKYPWLWAMDKPVKKRPAIFIVNLQWTPKDDVAILKINGKCDMVMSLVMENLRLGIPKYSKVRDPIFSHASYLSPRELHTTSMAMLVRGPPFAPEIGLDSDRMEPDCDDTDEDCPLNILKTKIKSNSDQDLKSSNMIPLEVAKHANIETKSDSAFDCSILKDCLSSLNDFDNDDGQNVEASQIYSKCTATPMDLSMNYFEPKNTNLKDEIDFDSLNEDFDKLQVEMKTSASETKKVSILLVKSPVKNENIEPNSELEPPKIIPFDTGQLKSTEYFPLLKTDLTYKFLKTDDADNNVENVLDLSRLRKCILEDYNYSNLSNISRANNTAAKEHLLNGSLYTYSKQRGSSSLRHFRKFKSADVQSPNDVNEEHLSMLQLMTPAYSEMKRNEFLSNGFKKVSFNNGAINLSLSKYAGHTTFTNVNKINRVYPPVLQKPRQPAKVDSTVNIENGSTLEALDLRKKEKGAHFNRKHSRRKDKSSTDTCISDSTSNDNSQDSVNQDDTSYEDMFNEYQSLAQAIIQHTLMMSYCEVKYAYSGFHSIINPVPFVQYDFQSVFKAINFMRYGQMLLNNKKRKKKTTKPKKMMNGVKKRKIIKRKERHKSFQAKKKNPQCQNCYDNHKVYYCKFYTPHNSDARFEKYRNNKLVMCLCCDESESSDGDEDDDACDEMKDDKQDRSDSTQEDVTDKEMADHGDDISKSYVLEGAEATSDEKKHHAQPGWFGRGYRKNRRRKR